ncbi:zinc finger and BTB domain-containing protein 41-like isoform X2 [Plodia interpunctella]|uniref:zinc finger and BTB domain-containing protein 41-like isoform X2 n=1 Tax=Plodia interpunctella TaxID=58824 RepID=UPI002368BD7B|nr:zinc finger and BTB domain-containing protein 41-like isoform X2 [Plodia interpunctella]
MDTDLKVNVKVEPDSENDASHDEKDFKQVEQALSDNVMMENVNIKLEAMNDEPCSAPESITVKLEPTYYSSGDEEIPLEYVAAQITMQYRDRPRKRRPDSDDEYIPPRRLKKKKKKKEANVKPTYRGKSKKEENMLYSEDVTKHIEIITITEQERQREIGETLNLRKNFQFRCEWCAIGFVLEEAYDAHMKIHSQEAGDHECELCRARVKTKTMLYRHKLRHYRRYRCSICHIIHKDKDTASAHVMTEHAHQAFVCGECSRSFKRPRYLERHIEQHHTKLFNFECPEPDCKRVFHEKGRYRSHVRSHKAELRHRAASLVVCAVCSKGYKSKSCLKRHLQTHLSTVCILCCVPFEHQEALRLHYAHVHNSYYDGVNIGERCPHCALVCASNALLNKHIKRMHRDRTKKYQCDYCQRLYLTKGEVRAHILWSHERRGGHACAAPGCGRVFRSPARLKSHTSIDHLGLPPPKNHECPECGKGFINKQVLQRHLRVHSNEKYPCKECGMLFKTEPYVRVHYQLKHLNMTRAQIKEEVRLRKTQSINLFKPTTAEIKQAKATPVNINQQIKTDSFIPMFETFVDVQRDILKADEIKQEPGVAEC